MSNNEKALNKEFEYDQFVHGILENEDDFDYEFHVEEMRKYMERLNKEKHES